MIVKEEFLAQLKDFGLNSYEAKIWCALLSKGVSTAGELSDIATVPRSRSYDVLESLERKGFIITKLGKPFKYLAVSPHEVIERVKKNITNIAEKNISILNNIKTTPFLEELNLLHSEGIESLDPTEFTGYIKTRNAIHSHMIKMINNSQSNLVLACSNQELLLKYSSIEKALKNAHQRNLEIKILISGKEKEDPKIKHLKKYTVIKQTSDYKNRFIISDKKEVLLMLHDETSVHPLYDTGIWLNSSFFVNSLTQMFNHTWAQLK